MKARPEDLPEYSLLDGVTARFFSGEKMMFSYISLGPGVILPNHSHPHEQMGFVLEGSLVIVNDGEEIVLTKGEMYLVRGGQRHEAVAGGDGALVLDVFSPPREDYLKMGR